MQVARQSKTTIEAPLPARSLARRCVIPDVDRGPYAQLPPKHVDSRPHRAIIRADIKSHGAAMTQNSILEPPALRSFDSLPVRTATPDMIDLEKVTAHISR